MGKSNHGGRNRAGRWSNPSRSLSAKYAGRVPDATAHQGSGVVKKIGKALAGFAVAAVETLGSLGDVLTSPSLYRARRPRRRRSFDNHHKPRF